MEELANETGRATEQIAQQVQTIRTQTGEAVRSIGEIESSIHALTESQQAIDDPMRAQATAGS